MLTTWNVNIAHIVINNHGPIYSEVIELLTDAFRQLKIDTIVSTNKLRKDRLNIVVGHAWALPANTTSQMADSGCPYVVLQLEILSEQEGWIPDRPHYIPFLKRAISIWDYNENNIKFLLTHGIANLNYIPIGHSAVLERIRQLRPEDQDIDVLFCGVMSERRRKVVQALRDSGMKVETPFGIYGQVRDQWIARSKIILNLHNFETTQLETIRISYLLNNKCFVISESSDCNPYGEGVVFSRYETLVSCCEKYLASGMDAERERIAALGYTNLKAIPMLESVMAALNWQAAIH